MQQIWQDPCNKTQSGQLLQGNEFISQQKRWM